MSAKLSQNNNFSLGLGAIIGLKIFVLQIQIRNGSSSHNVTIERPEEEKDQIVINQTVLYEVDLSLYPSDTKLSFKVKKQT